MPKKTVDLRGRLSSLSRLRMFDREAFVHAIFYRLVVIFSVIYGVVLLVSLGSLGLGPAVKALTVIEWVLFTPELFEVVKAFSLISTGGRTFGKLNPSYAYILKRRYGRPSKVYTALPYFVLGVWAAGFVAMLVWWPL